MREVTVRVHDELISMYKRFHEDLTEEQILDAVKDVLELEIYFNGGYVEENILRKLDFFLEKNTGTEISA
ncbi:MAG: hypothetical protein EPN93_17355 [Spirochaetes bacterium]|nr:MAG: hypothetical protein EPN93_17355 [Spirochaetota bacterium]